MRKVFLLFTLLGLTACKSPLHNLCQPKEVCISDLEYELDLGTVSDTVEVLNRSLTILNDTADTVRITRVGKSCGCTQLQLSNSIIAPYETVMLDLAVDIGLNYNFFEKDITIYTDHRNDPLIIYVRASRRLPEQAVYHDFPMVISNNLRINTPFIVFGYVALGDVAVSHINIYNESDSRSSFEVSVKDLPPYMSVFYNETLKPHEIGRIAIMIDLSKINDVWGVQRHILHIKDRKEKIGTDIPLETIFVEKLVRTPSSPRLMIPVTNYTVDKSVRKEIRFLLKNIGKESLHVRDIQIPVSQDVVLLSSPEIKPDAEESLTVNLESLDSGVFEIGLTTNDPIEPYKILRVNCR